MSEVTIGFDFSTPVVSDSPGVNVTPNWTPHWDLRWSPVWTLIPVDESLLDEGGEEGEIVFDPDP